MFEGKSLSDRAIAATIALMFSATTCALFLMQVAIPDTLMVINTVVVLGWFQSVRERQNIDAGRPPEPTLIVPD